MEKWNDGRKGRMEEKEGREESRFSFLFRRIEHRSESLRPVEIFLSHHVSRFTFHAMSLCAVFLILGAMDSSADQWYAGDAHIHTFPHGGSTVAERVDEGIYGHLDWLVITEHERYGMFKWADEVAKEHAEHYPAFSPLLGMEWDDMTAVNGGDVILFGVPPIAELPITLQDTIDWVNHAGGVFLYAHPGELVWEYCTTWQDAVGFEGFSGGRWMPEIEIGAEWDQLLTIGERVFIDGSSDNHGQKYLGDRIVKTYVWAPSTSERDIVGAFQRGRMSVAEKDRAQILTFTVNGKMMGEVVEIDGDSVHVELRVRSIDPLSKLTLVANKKAVWTWDAKERSYNHEAQFELPITPDLCYLRLVVECLQWPDTTFRTLSNPIFLEQPESFQSKRP